MEYFELDNVVNKKPDTTLLHKLLRYGGNGLSVVYYSDGTLIVEQDGLTQNPFMLAKLRNEIINNKKNIVQIGVSSKEIIAKEIGRARVLAQDSEAQNENTFSEAQQMIEQITEHAITYGCSDVHIFLRNPNVEIRFRKFGLATPPQFTSFEYEQLTRMIARLFNWTGANNSDGEFSLKTIQSTTLTLDININGKITPTRLRIEKIPLEELGDAKIVFRVSPAVQSKTLEVMGVDPKVANIISAHMKKPSGLVVVSGPTGSGKTTVLHAALHEIPDTSICNTLEDPVEVLASFNTLISQHNRDPLKGYNEQIKSLLRLDPDIIVIGEMRDEESAKSTVRASLTGHLVLTTLHTNNSLGIVPRLNDLGISYSDLSLPDTLSLLLAIRLAPMLCDSCKLPVSTNEKLRQQLVKNPLAKIGGIFTVNHKSCRNCTNGISKRKPIIEYINIDEGIRSFISKGDIQGAQNYLLDNNWQSLTELAWKEINAGNLCPILAEKEFKNVIHNAGKKYIYEEL